MRACVRVCVRACVCACAYTLQAAVAIRLPDYEGSRHMCRAVGVSLHHGDPPEGISKLRSLMFPVLARAVEMQDDAAGDS